jgi:hypothetical protein
MLLLLLPSLLLPAMGVRVDLLQVSVANSSHNLLPALLLTPQIAVSLNYNKVFGWIDIDSISPEYISKNFDAEWKKQSGKYPMDLPNMKKLYEAVDVIGLSGGKPSYVVLRRGWGNMSEGETCSESNLCSQGLWQWPSMKKQY